MSTFDQRVLDSGAKPKRRKFPWISGLWSWIFICKCRFSWLCFNFPIFSLSAGTRFDPIPGWELHSFFLANLLLDSACFYSACGCCSEFLRLIICSGKNVKSNQITEIAEITEIFDWKFHDFYNFLKTCATLLKGYFYFEKDSKGPEIEPRYESGTQKNAKHDL